MRNTFPLRMRDFIALPLMLFLLAISLIGRGQSVSLDQADLDYAPGETVYITGEGWYPNEEITLTVDHLSTPIPDHGTTDPHLPWKVIADANGNFTSEWYVTEYELGAELLLLAGGAESGYTYEIFFTDANSAIALVSPFTVIYGSSITLTATLTQQGGGASSGTPIANRVIDFTLSGGIFLGSSITNNSGIASLNLKLVQAVGNYNGSNGIKANFVGDPSNNPYSGASKTNAVNITKANTSFSSIIGSGIYGADVVLTATVNLNISGLPINFSLDGNSVGIGYTDETGVAALTVPFASIPASIKNAGTYLNKITASIANTLNYNASSGNGNLTISKADQTISWGNPSNIIYGTLLSATQLNATVAGVTGGTAPGALTYTPASGVLLNAGSQTLKVDAAEMDNYKAASKEVNIFVEKAPSITTISISGAPFTYTGSAITPATVSVTGAGGLNLTPVASYANNTNAGTATASYTYAGDDNHLGSSDSKTFTIDKAPSVTTVSISGAPFTYTGSAITPATVSVTGAGGLNLTPTPNYANNTNAGTATAGYTYAGDDNHLGSNDSKTFTIDKASSTTVVSITGAPFTYTGSAITPASVSVTGAGGLNLTPTPNYANNINAGTAAASYTYAGDANHLGSSDTEDFEIGKAASTTVVNITGAPFTYTGSAITPATVSVTGAGGLNLTPVASYANNTNAGTATASYNYAGDANHLGSSDSEDFEIGKAASTTVVTISEGPFIYIGSAIEPASVLVTGAGGLSLTPVASYANNINTGTATASYTYTGDANHYGSEDSKTFTIDKAPSVTTVSISGAPFTYTGSAITPATVSVTGAGGLNLTPVASYANNTNAGTATASYTYAGDDNHLGSSDSKTFTIDKAPSVTTVSISGAPFTYTGSAIEPATVLVTGAGGLSLTPMASYANNINAGTATASYTYAGDDNHYGSEDSKTFEIGKADAIIFVEGYSGNYDGLTHGAIGTAKGVNNELLLGLNLGNSFINVPGGTAIWVFTDVTGNYNNATGSVKIDISKATSTTVVSITGAPFAYTGSAIEPATVSVTGAGGLNLTPIPNYANNINAGTALASYTYAGDDNHLGSDDSKTFTIDKASSTTVVSIVGGPFTYTGSAITPATVSVTGAGGLNLTPTASYANNITAGTATASYTYAGDDNHLGSDDSKTFTIDKASSTTVVSIVGGPFTYTGSAITPATVSVTGAGGLNLTPVASYANNINAGTATANYTYTGDANYLGSSDSENFDIGKADAIIVVNSYDEIYNGLTHSSTYTAIGVETPTPADLASLMTVSGTTHTNAGNYNGDTWSFAGSDNYNAASGTVNNKINPRPITVNADALCKYIGQVDPALTYKTSEALIAGDTFFGSLSRLPGECAGTYRINIGSLSLSSNYSLSYNGADLTINGVSIDASQSSTPIPMGSTATLYAKVTPAAPDVYVTFTLDNGTNIIGNPITIKTNSLGIASTSVGILPVEVYKVIASIGSCTSSTAAYLAVYDPNGGFVTGGGWINSPAGAYSANPVLTGKANFGFNSKYKKGNNVPDGNTEFQFQTGNLNFSSSTYNVGSLVIAGSKATYKGVGTINGSGSYAFMVSAVDGEVSGGGGIDKFRIKIWNGNNVIYDNNMGKDENDLPTTALGGGSIVIHSAESKTKLAQISPDASTSTFEASLKVYPNPFTDRLNIEFSYATDTKAKLEIYSVTGAKLQTLYDGPVSGGQLYNFEYLPRLVSSQVVFYHLTLDGKTQVGKILFNERK